MRGIVRVAAFAALLFTVGCVTVDRPDVTTMAYADRLRLASLYIQDDQGERAESVLKDAVRRDPDRPEAYAMLGDIYYNGDELGDAALQYLKALERDSGDPVILNNLAWVEMERENFGPALANIDRAVRMAPIPLYPYLDTRTRILRAAGDLEGALSSAKLTLSLAPRQEVELRTELVELIRSLEIRIEKIGP